MQELSTAALPDIVFILLFFFMTTAAFKDSEVQVQNELPSASELETLERSEKVISLWIGRPLNSVDDAVAVIQLDDALISVESLETAVMNKINTLPEDLKPGAEVLVKVDQGVKLSVVQDVKERLSEVSVRKVHYVALPMEGN